ncbi:substrate-binding domain-containing protein [Hufsiella ginkgonis]|uniref:Substrate-binding domain-containing protein n=1 Tax=Hufsiella ginkgonis TaxID=2695274 RepID=A0A7K1XW74_9SPHI|nr:substrate-binding domain-containing protein [Hufsiella ginkgonis]MXV15242.1 substrate-binding domain-containing protein [Hufsiella ginkgonis]
MSSDFYEYINVDVYSATPKYLQLANSILNAIEAGVIGKNRLLPSLNDLRFNLEISRDTADRGYKYLNELGVLKVIPGKGHFTTTASIKQKLNILILVNELNDERKAFYDAFVNSLGEPAAFDFYVYNNEYQFFKRLLMAKSGYSHYLIIPNFNEDADLAAELIDSIPKEKLILLDALPSEVNGSFGAVYLNFKQCCFELLEKALPALSKYDTLNLVFPADNSFNEELVAGFEAFCMEYAFERKVINQAKKGNPEAGQAYICLREEDMVTLIEQVNNSKLTPGVDIGILSYNDTPLKKYILNGVSTFSVDYHKMGSLAAKMIREEQNAKMELSYELQLRGSL